MESLPIVYRPDIQQGNVVSQEMVNQLQPGMSRHQVRFIMGTPMLVDVFHQNRWDYVYTLTEGWSEMQERRLSLYFEDDRLVRIEGDMRPGQESAAVPEKGGVVSVPDHDGSGKGIVTRTIEAVEEFWSDDPRQPPEDETMGEMEDDEEAEATEIIEQEEGETQPQVTE